MLGVSFGYFNYFYGKGSGVLRMYMYMYLLDMPLLDFLYLADIDVCL